MNNPLFEINETSEKRYMDGKINQIIRWYYYFTEGVGQLNSARTLGYALIGLGGVFAVSQTGSNWLLIIGIGLIAIPILTLGGYIWVRRGKKSSEYYQIKYTSPFGRYNIQMSEKQVTNLNRIIEQNDRIIQLLQELNKEVEELKSN